MKKKYYKQRQIYYFKHSGSEICYTKAYFDNYMKQNGLTEIEVYNAEREKIPGIFWCKEHQFCGDGTLDTCGKRNCNDYKPRNKVSGCCVHHTSWLYTHTDKITLKL